jgi:pimeloyl-ACP methyl ester carboxylesterase
VPHARLDGFEMYYERHGERGEPLVLVHGYTGDVSDWERQLEAFAATHRVLVMDHRGHGRSGAPRDRASYTVESMAGDVEALAAHAGFDRYHLVGHSLGGMIAQEIALRSGERLLSLTLEDTLHDFAIGPSEPVRRLFDARLRFAEEQGMAAVARLPAPPRAPHHPPERFAQEQARLARMPLDGFVGGWQALCGWAGTEQRAHAIRTRTLVIHGELDAPVIAGSRWLAGAIPGARLEVVPEAGHSPQLERPELFNAALRRHLEAGRAA